MCLTSTPEISDFLAELAEFFAHPPVGSKLSRVIVNGRPGRVLEYLPGQLPGRPGLVTCTCTYIVEHDDGEQVTYVVNDWDQNAPKVERAQVTVVPSEP